MRFNYDLLPGEVLPFDEIAERYSQKYPEDKSLTPRGLLSPSTSSKSWIIRAVFASRDIHPELDDVLFISNDNERKNYLQRFEHYLQRQESFLYFRRPPAPAPWNVWKVMGESRVVAMLDPASIMAQSLMAQRGFTLSLLRTDEEEEYWQLYDSQTRPCFEYSRQLQFLVVLSSPLLPPTAGVMPGTQVGRRVKARLWQRISQQSFSSAVRERYGACVITGTRLHENASCPWVEACHINMEENESGFPKDNNVDNGLFLRSDLQRLFSSRLLIIDAATGKVAFRHALAADEELSASYQELIGQTCALWDRVPQATRERLQKLR
ncbi:HNH endonuclease signature motif containing protein [Erwinia phyllosphaerae]|uniref:HNH endonuclease signature motif containing protein n=1 Tax=Erwinia phyllosphaerae TaxID=2853256 RepID=UPI001FEE0172|nr:HNH endonuclease signature motif containing protein [Erwinia phyllosphaerae]MBV4366381.1 HNH endonuclease [Erwinia phyllosphaerae]